MRINERRVAKTVSLLGFTAAYIIGFQVNTLVGWDLGLMFQSSGWGMMLAIVPLCWGAVEVLRSAKRGAIGFGLASGLIVLSWLMGFNAQGLLIGGGMTLACFALIVAAMLTPN